MDTHHTSATDGISAWIVATVATAVLGVVLGVFGSIGVLIGPLATAYGAPRSQLVLLFAAALAVHSVTARGAGPVLDRWGPRPLLAAAGVGMVVGPLAAAAAPTVWLAVGGYGAGVGLASACTWVATTGVVSAAFQRRRSAALGLLTAGPAAGGVVLAPMMAALAQARGPATTCVLVAALGFTACAAGAVLLGRHRAHAPATARTGASDPEPTPRRFLAAALLMSLVVFVPIVHLAATATGLGLSTSHGAVLLAVVSAVSAATRLGTGWLATPQTLPSFYRAAHLLVAAAFSAWALTAHVAASPTFPAFLMLLVVAALFGAGYGAWLSLGPAILAATCTPARLGRALGALASIVGLGGVIGPVLAGPLLETSATALLIGCALTALAAAAALTGQAVGARPALSGMTT